ncbi:Trafficking protein particle complex subunit 4, partial [Cucurbita argyrosperma subsp. argyrosperma]
MAAIYSLYIINKSGGLIFYKDYGSAGRMDTNDSLRVASLWHSMHAISQQLSPISGCSGTELLEADTFDLHCFQSLTDQAFSTDEECVRTMNQFYNSQEQLCCRIVAL